MPRRKKIDRPRALEVQLPDSIYTKVKAELYSDIEGKVPFGAMSALAEELLTDWLRTRGVIV
jgi:hypothetical protein